MDQTTFGGSEAAQILVTILNRLSDPTLNARVGRFMNRSNNGFAALNAIEDDRFFRRFVNLWRKERLAEIERSPFHPEVDSYLRNVVVTAGKNWIRA